jgi:hypothetical protein
MKQNEIILLADASGISLYGMGLDREKFIHYLEAFAKLVEEHVRKTINDEAKAHLEELRKNFNVESAELRLHQWSKEKQA